ncbi:MAG: RNA methyltransferase [Prevotella sp.]|nr:RNA methyltransferase [Prevotella sp.]
MLSKATIKRIRALEMKKFRRQTGLFVAEGPKVVGDLLEAMVPQEIFATAEWLKKNQRLVGENSAMSGEKSAAVTEVSEEELRRLSFLQHPQQVLATFPIPSSPNNQQVATSIHQSDSPLSTWRGAGGEASLSIALDGIQDPGNLGTIIRIADWFGIDTIFCSPDTADAYAPKVVQATMGSLARVHLVYQDLATLLDALPADFPVYGTLLDGDDIYQQRLTSSGIIVMGNEGNGISPAIAARVNRRLLIPNFPEDRPTADSLNVAIATAVTCAEFRRQELQNNR